MCRVLGLGHSFEPSTFSQPGKFGGGLAVRGAGESDAGREKWQGFEDLNRMAAGKLTAEHKCLDRRLGNRDVIFGANQCLMQF